VKFRRSSFCSDVNCVEVVFDEAVVHIRDRTRNYITYTYAEWAAFVRGVKAGEFDVPEGRRRYPMILDREDGQ
jgi:Domain of unknown function (DUF397)